MQMSHQTLLNIPPDLPKDCTHGEQNEPGSCGSMPGSAAQSGSTCVPARPHRSPRISYRCHTGEGMKAPSSTTQINIEVLFQLDQTSWSISCQLGQVQWPRARTFQKGSLCGCKGGNHSNDAHGDRRSLRRQNRNDRQRLAKTLRNQGIMHGEEISYIS